MFACQALEARSTVDEVQSKESTAQGQGCDDAGREAEPELHV